MNLLALKSHTEKTLAEFQKRREELEKQLAQLKYEQDGWIQFAALLENHERYSPRTTKAGGVPEEREEP